MVLSLCAATEFVLTRIVQPGTLIHLDVATRMLSAAAAPEIMAALTAHLLAGRLVAVGDPVDPAALMAALSHHQPPGPVGRRRRPIRLAS